MKITPEEFKDIAPFDDVEVKEMMKTLVDEPGFIHAVKYVLPSVDYDAFVKQLLTLDSKEAFQRNIMVPFLQMLADKTSAGIVMEGMENSDINGNYTYISNHRDIVLDASFLFVLLLKNGYRGGEIALGDNLLIFEWIERLVKLNRGFIVRRGLPMREAFQAARHLSAYIHYCITKKGESVWIAQREGRAKDSNDRTQESVIKMLALDKGEDIIDSLLELNITPVTISYEYDPNDYLKATEFMLRRRDPKFTKSKNDDLLSMETGLLGYKGHINYRINPSINHIIESLRNCNDRNVIISSICAAIDRQIHLGYKIYPSNYIAYDRLAASNRFSYKYTPRESAEFDRYLESQLDKVRVADVSEDDRQYMHHMMLTMYANPLINKLVAMGKQS